MFAGVDQFYGTRRCERAAPASAEHARPDLPDGGGRLRRGSRRGDDDGEQRRSRRSVGIQIPSVDNWIAGFQQGVYDTKPEVDAPGRVLERLRRSGSVQGDRARPHRAGRRRRLPGGRPLRAGRARRRLLGRGVRDRRRCGPVVRGALRHHERAEAAPVVGLRRRQVVRRRNVHDGRQLLLRRSPTCRTRSSLRPSPLTCHRTCRTPPRRRRSRSPAGRSTRRRRSTRSRSRRVRRGRAASAARPPTAP